MSKVKKSSLGNFSRRTILKAGAASLLLPLLPELNASAQSVSYPKRLIMFHVPEGIEPQYWWPTTPGTGFQLLNSLAPLAANKADITLVKGINATASEFYRNGGCYHNTGMPHLLTGGTNAPALSWNNTQTPGGISIDRFIGKHVQGTAAFQTYELGIEVGGADNQRRICFDAKDAPRDPISNPYQIYKDLSGLGGSAALIADRQKSFTRRKSILDVLRGEISKVRCQLGAESKAKLDAHISSVDSLESQYQKLSQAGGNFSSLVNVDAKWNDGSLNYANANYPTVGQLQMDTVVAALQTDLLRVATIQWSNTVSRVDFSQLIDVKITGNHHDAISHNESAQAALDRKAIYTWYAQQFAYLINKLKQVPEGTGTMLDNTLVVYFSEMSIGNSHYPNELPIILAGGGSKKIKLGRYIDLTNGGNSNGRSLSDLWTTVAQSFDIGVPKFGEAQFTTGPITELTT